MLSITLHPRSTWFPRYSNRLNETQHSSLVLGDHCESGQEFPVTIDGTLLVGCSTFAGEKWCRRQDSTYILCPSFRFESIPDTETLSPERKHSSTTGTNVVISEFMVANNLFSDEDGDTSDWIELHNAESTPVELTGWVLTDDPEDLTKWSVPAITVESGGYAIIFASGKDRVSDLAAHTNFRLSIDGEYLALVRPDGTLASVIENDYPKQIPDISYGIPYFNRNDAEKTQMTFLAKPTPGEANSGPLVIGPYISRVQHDNEGALQSPGIDITVTAVVSESAHPIDQVTLVYQVMYGKERTLSMRRGTRSADPVYSGVISAEEFQSGEMVRWFVLATDVEGNEFRDPPNTNEDYPLHYGTVIQQDLDTQLPVLYWYSNDTAASLSEDGFSGSLFYGGEFYDNVFTRRRGVTALSWPKPKIKFDFKGKAFKYKKSESRVEEFNLQSFWDEIGEDSYLREPVAFQVHQEAGVPASNSFHLVVHQNGQYFGLFAFVEQVDESFLQRNGISTGGDLFKSVHGQFSNLRWDVKPKDLKYTYAKGNKKGVENWIMLWELTQGLAGGGPVSRSSFLFDYINIPQVINYMAVSNMLLNQDRCTKNFYVYKNPIDERWSVFPWDTEASMGISSGLRGRPADDYCILECEQWNSPFYCDSEHPQDLPGLVNLEIQTGRRLSQVTRARRIPREFRIPSVEDYNEDRTETASVTGAKGTYNHLDDAILDWSVTREMYLRRLRTLMDQFLNGRLERIITQYYETIQEDAVKDNKLWQLTDDISKGYEQLITEQLPRRKEQLYDIYGPAALGIIPKRQSQNAVVRVSHVETPDNREEQYIELSNPSSTAVDVSGWVLSGAAKFRFPEGTVIVANGSIFVTPNVGAFRNREKSPKGGDGVLYVGPASYMESGTTRESVNVVNLQGKII
eukprot:g6432.t1